MIQKKKIIFISVYIVLLFILFEGTARLVFSNTNLARRIWVDESLSWRRSWVQRHKDTGKQIYYTFDTYDSTKGWVSKPNLRDMPVFDSKVLSTNSKGFRGTTEYQYIKDQDKIRILVIGDSYTFGEEVSDNETYPFYLQELIQNSEVMNLGMHGYGHDQMLIFLKEEGFRYKPDIVILGFIHPDMTRNMVNFRDYAKPKFELSDEGLKLTSTPVPPLEQTLRWDWIRPRIIDVASIFRHNYRMRTGLYGKEKDHLTTAILTEIINQADNINAAPLFVYIPIIPEITSTDFMTPGEEYLSEMCNTSEKVDYFSTRPYFINQLKKGVTFKESGHWGPTGNYAIAEAIKQFLFENGYLALKDINNQTSTLKPYK